MARFTAATPDASGTGYVFEREDAPPIYLWGPEADDMAAELAAVGPLSSAFGGATAANEGFGSANAPHRQNFLDPGPAAPQATDAGGAAPPPPPPAPPPQEAMGPPRGAGPPIPAAPAPSAAGAPAAPGAALPPQTAAPVDISALPPQKLTTSYGGTKGVDPAKLVREGVPVPQTVTETVEGAQPYDQEAADARADLNINLQLAEQKQAEAAALRAQNEASQQAARVPGLLRDAAEARKFVDEIHAGYRQDEGDLQTMVQAQRAKQIDPRRVMRGNAIGEIISIIARGIGAYGAAISGGPNEAGKIIDKIIDDDIRAQESEIAKGQADVDNALAQLRRKFGDMDQAKAALRVMQHDVAETQGAAFAAETRSQDALMAFDKWAAVNAIERQKAEDAFKAAAVGKHTMAVTQKVIQPVAPTAGGVRAKTAKELAADQAARASYAESTAKIGEVTRGAPVSEGARQAAGFAGAAATKPTPTPKGEQQIAVPLWKGTVRAADAAAAREQSVNYKNVKQAIAEYKTHAAKGAGGAVGGEARDAAAAYAALKLAIKATAGKGAGLNSDTDMNTIADQVPKVWEVGTVGEEASIAQIERQMDQKERNEKASFGVGTQSKSLEKD